MRLIISMAVLSSVLTTTSAWAQANCGKLYDSTLRLDCYDRASRKSPPELSDRSGSDEHLEGEFELTDAGDLFATPDDFKGRHIEVERAQCFYAAKNEYRCLLVNNNNPVMIISQDVINRSEKERIQRDCRTERTIDTSTCTRKIRVVPLNSQQDEVRDGLGVAVKRVVLLAPVIEITTNPK